MYYDDEGRRFNLLSGLLFGTLLGAGVTLLLAPQRGRTRVPPERPPAGGGKKRARAATGGGLKRKVLRVVAASVADAWRRSG